MHIESLRKFCKTLPGVTEDVKWGNDLCFCIGAKMFCVTGLTGSFSASFKVSDDAFEELAGKPGIAPAPYVAKYKWVLVTEGNALSKKEWEQYIRQSYSLIKAKLPRKILKELGE